MNRRDFFRVVSTAGAGAAVAGCQPAAEKILPLVVPNEQLVPGVASWFATVCRECPAGCGVVARNREGRVVKLEGNPDHPVNQGALCVRGQAALQGLYHPDRFDGPRQRAAGVWKRIGWDEALALVSRRIVEERRAGGGGKRIALVSQLETGTLADLMDRWTQAIGARPRVVLEAFGQEAERAASRLVFGRDAVPHQDIGAATVLLSFGADYLETWRSPVEHARGHARLHAFAAGRAGTVIHVEPRQSLTASNADEWIRNAPGTEALVALGLLKIMVDEGLCDRRFGESVKGVDVARIAADSGVPAATLAGVARTFAAARPGLAIGGGVAASGSNATATLAAIHLLNAAAGNVGRTVRFGPDSAFGRVTPYGDVVALVEAMRAGQVDVLILGPGVNPAFTLPGGLEVEKALAKVGLVVSLASQPDETTALAHVVLPSTHWLESWGDYAPRAGVDGLLQPTMSPVKDARPAGDVLLALGQAVLGPRGPRADGREGSKKALPWASMADAVRGAWEPRVKAREAAEPTDGWQEALRRGGAWRDVPAAGVTAKPVALEVGRAAFEGKATDPILLAYPSARFYDGRSAGSSWLHEAPDTMTQAVWDAWVEVPGETARRLGVKDGDVLLVTTAHGSVELPAWISESLHPGAVAIPIGHRYAPYLAPRYVAAPRLSLNPVAVLAGKAEPASGGAIYLGTRVMLSRTGLRRPLAILQGSHDQDHREIAQHQELGAAREEALRGRPKAHELPSMYPAQQYPGYRWGLAIDVDRCVGCQACVVACQAENNVPVVGKAQAAYGRQLHWMRVERWAEGAPGHPGQIFLPMLCQHCEIAPCEPVCPVFAAYRTEEGLNAQVYNRCVGTRYCGNNCPYHVRRFNWFNYETPEPLDIQLNPDVTVRQLGVMEKCTMCVQRIAAGKDAARDAGRSVRDGDIRTACQQTCPTQAITFGNLQDHASAVWKLGHGPRAYHVLEELGTRPSVTYLKKVVRRHA